MNVFIADDSEIMRDRLARMVSEIEGLEVAGQAANGREALEGIRALKPDVLILDIRMPELSGIQVLEELRTDNGHRMLVIVFTNYPYAQYSHKCIALGADNFLDKSISADRVRENLTDYVGKADPEDVPET